MADLPSQGPLDVPGRFQTRGTTGAIFGHQPRRATVPVSRQREAAMAGILSPGLLDLRGQCQSRGVTEGLSEGIPNGDLPVPPSRTAVEAAAEGGSDG